MHIPDHFLSTPVWLGAYAVSAAAVGVATKRAGRDLDDLKVPLMGVMGAFIFAAQMINFPIPFGTSGHLVGTVLLTVLLGPNAALLTVTCILIVQCLLFQDGGVTALGANVLNMAVLPVCIGYPVYLSVRRLLNRWHGGWLAGAAVAAWSTVVLGAVAASIEMALSGRWPFVQSVAVMGGLHVLVGLGEAAITVAVLAFIARVRRDLAPAAMQQEEEPA